MSRGMAILAMTSYGQDARAPRSEDLRLSSCVAPPLSPSTRHLTLGGGQFLYGINARMPL